MVRFLLHPPIPFLSWTAANADNGDRMSRMFSNMRSPSIKSKSKATASVPTDSFSLEFDANGECPWSLVEISLTLKAVPVYDARDVEFDFQTDLERLTYLPRWETEIPFGSFCVPGYTVAVFRPEKTRAWTVSLNIQWVVLIGVPEEETE
jgi:hypothetical protein